MIFLPFFHIRRVLVHINIVLLYFFSQMSTITPNTSLTTFGDITSDQDHLWPSFALWDDENELDRLQAKRRAIDAKIAQLERQQQMIMGEAEATPKAKANFETSTDVRNGNELFGDSLTLKVEELSKKIGQMAVQLNAEKQKEAGKLSKETEKKVLLIKFAELSQKIGQMEIQLKTVDLKEKNKYSQLKMENKELKINFGELRKKFERTERELQDMKQTVARFSRFESENKKVIAKFPEIDKFFNVNTEGQKKGANDGGEANVFGRKNDQNTKLSTTRSINHLPLLVEGHWHRLILCNGMTCESHNGFAWYFLLLHPDKADQIPSRPNTEYGMILYSGLGRYPPSDVIKQINTKYGLNKSWKPNKK